MKKITLVFLSLLCLLCFSCTHSYDDMITTFNKKYFSPAQPKLPDYSITGADFVASEMLEPSYLLPCGYYVDIEAPRGGKSYKWYVEGMEEECSTKPEFSKRVFHYEIPGLFKLGEENTLVLTVTAADDKGNVTEYIDKAVIIIKKPDNSGEEN